MQSDRRSGWTLAALAAPCLPMAGLGLPLVVYLPEHYANELGLPLAETAFLVYANIVCTVRTTMITPYEVPGLYAETVRYVVRALGSTVEQTLPDYLRPRSMMDESLPSC